MGAMKGFFLRLGSADPDRVSWAEVVDDGEVLVQTGSLSEAVAEAQGRGVTVFVPGQDMLLLESLVPKGSRKQVSLAIPYAIEEQYVSEAEELHFAQGARNSEGLLSLALIDAELLDAVLARLREIGIDPHFMTPDILALPLYSDGWTILIDGPIALVRTGVQAGFAVDAANFETVLASELKSRELSVPLVLHLYALDEFQVPADDFFTPHAIDYELIDEPLEILVNGLDEKAAINLLQGPYNRHAQWGNLWERWQLPLVILLLFLVIRGGLLMQEYNELRQERLGLSQRIEQVYRDLFPQAKNVVDPKAQMAQKLVELRAKGAGGGGFLGLLDKSTDLLLATPGFKLINMRYKDGRLDLAFYVGSLQSLDELKVSLAGVEGLAVEIRTASAKGDNVEARLQIKEAGS